MYELNVNALCPVPFLALGSHHLSAEEILCFLTVIPDLFLPLHTVVTLRVLGIASSGILSIKSTSMILVCDGDYHKTLKSYGIDAAPFSRLKGNADSEFNNHSHRKITVIDGKIGYTGGVNIADEYINEVVKYGHWKDTAIRLEGEAVWELTKLFLVDFGINVRKCRTLMINSIQKQM